MYNFCINNSHDIAEILLKLALNTNQSVINILASCGVDHRFIPRSDQTKDYEIGICCFSTKHTALARAKGG